MEFTATTLYDALLVVLGLALDRALLLPSYLEKRSKKNAFVLLSGSWESGVVLLNTGMHNLNPTERQTWYNDVQKWRDELYAIMEKHVPERLGTVRTIGLHRTIQPYGLNDPHAVSALSDLWTTLERLKGVLEDYSPL